MLTVESPVLCYEPTAVLVADENGSPVVSVQVYFDAPEAPDALNPEVIRLYMEPVEAKRLGLLLIRVGQDGIEREIEMERLAWRLK